MNVNQIEENYTELPSSVWKILNSKNGDKYITFADTNTNESDGPINSVESK